MDEKCYIVVTLKKINLITLWNGAEIVLLHLSGV